MRFFLPALVLVGGVTTPQMVAAIGVGDADTIYGAYNQAFLKQPNGQIYYALALNNSSPDEFYTAVLKTFAVEDAYERTGDLSKKTLVGQLLNTSLVNSPSGSASTPWSYNSFNYQLGWIALALVQGYWIRRGEILDVARSTFDFAYERGWDNTTIDGGISHRQPDPDNI